MNYFPRLALNRDPPDLCPLNSWDDRCESPVPSILLLFDNSIIEMQSTHHIITHNHIFKAYGLVSFSSLRVVQHFHIILGHFHHPLSPKETLCPLAITPQPPALSPGNH
jgi:hypothetical protein